MVYILFNFLFKKKKPNFFKLLFSEPSKEKVISPRARVKIKETIESDRKVTQRTKILVSLYRQKEFLKKDILRKRALLEKELQYEIQVTYLLFFVYYFNYYNW